jgi:hypothetical protein
MTNYAIVVTLPPWMFCAYLIAMAFAMLGLSYRTSNEMHGYSAVLFMLGLVQTLVGILTLALTLTAMPK